MRNQLTKIQGKMMEMNKIFELRRQARTITAVNRHLFDMELSNGAIRQYVLLLQNVGTHTHAEFSSELGITGNTYLTKLKELKKKGLILAQNIDPAIDAITRKNKTKTIVMLHVQSAYEKHMNTIS